MIEAEERAQMSEAVRGALAGAVANGDDVDATLAKLDWLEMLRDEPDDAIGIVFGALGRTNAAATALDDVLAAALGHEPRPDLAVLLPPFAAWAAPGRVAGGELRAEGLATARAAGAHEWWVVCETDAGPRATLVPAAAAEIRRVDGVDPGGGLHSVRIQADAPDLVPADWTAALGRGRRAVAHQIEGGCRTLLELARSHTLEREQFGGPIARFQAVRHKLAEALVATEALEAALDAARQDPGPETAALAKAVAGRSQRTVARHAQQVLAGIGFTIEHALHRYLKRTMALEGLLGSADAIALDVGRRLLAERRVPTLIEL
ncbi:MAG TPA: acyl-CoA dehydrogenase family protein [Myxococcota bacterium]|nr:acyl-CoA dehydrogenase family protein [Myxococcota bacterium]